MHFTLKQLEYFSAAATHGNLTTAAKALHVSQPSISGAIAHLEKSFDVQLMRRHRAKGVSLTSAGRAFASEVRSLLAHAGELRERATELGTGLAGRLDVGCFVTFAPFYLPGLLMRFAESYPDIAVNIHEGTLDSLQAQLADGTCELALLYDIGVDDALVAQPVNTLPPYVLLSAGHRLAKRRALSLHDLARERFILLDLPHSRDYFLGLFLREGVEPRVAHRTTSLEMVRGMVSRGFGYSILCLRPAADIAYDGSHLACIPLRDELPPLSIVLAHASGARLSARARVFSEHCLRGMHQS
jgi:DNA-binding transcriptional LysR family regulator